MWIIPLSRTLHSDSILNFNLAQAKDKKELSSFSFMNMFVPPDSWNRLKSRDCSLSEFKKG